MNTAPNTPLPWHVDQPRIYNAGKTLIATVAYFRDTAEQRSNAELIVKACNEYASLKSRADAVDGLVEALKLIAEPLRGVPVGDPWGFYADLQYVASKALAALSLVVLKEPNLSHLAVARAEPESSLEALRQRCKDAVREAAASDEIFVATALEAIDQAFLVK